MFHKDDVCCISQYYHRLKSHSMNKNKKKLSTDDDIPIIVVETCTTPEDQTGYEQFRVNHVRKALTANDVENMSNIDDWDVLGLVDNYNNDVKNFLRPKTLFIGKSETELELHKHFTENEKRLLVRKRYKRRYAVQIENVEELKIRLKTYMSLISFNFHWSER